MKHLTADDIINFVSMTELNDEAVVLSATVNGHIRKCEKCLKLVRAFQIIYDEFSRCNGSGDFNQYLFQNVLEAEDKHEIKSRTVIEEFEGFR